MVLWKTSMYLESSYCVCMKLITLCNCLCSSSSSSSSSRFSASYIRNIGEFRAKVILQTIEKLTQISYLFRWQVQCSGLFYCRTSHSDGEFPGDYFINIATIYMHIIKTDIKWWPKTCLHFKISEQKVCVHLLYFR